MKFFKEICDQNVKLQNEVDYLNHKIETLQKDIEEYRTILWNFENDFNLGSTKQYKVSTPNKNFISYEALNVENISFSIDEDYEYDNIIFDEKFKYLSSTSSEIAQNNFSDQLPSEFGLCTFNCIENEEMPSRILKDQTTEHLLQSYLFSESMKKTMSNNEISSIEDQKIPELFEPTMISEKNSGSGNKTHCFSNDNQMTFCFSQNISDAKTDLTKNYDEKLANEHKDQLITIKYLLLNSLPLIFYSLIFHMNKSSLR